MKTNIGEIKSKWDLFELMSERSEPSQVAGWNEIPYQTHKCKLCEEVLEEYLGPTMGGGLDIGFHRRIAHLDLHKIIKNLGI